MPPALYVTLPKIEGLRDAQSILQDPAAIARSTGLERQIPVHMLIETYGALREVNGIHHTLHGMEILSSGLMDFENAYHGAIPGRASAALGVAPLPLSATRPPNRRSHCLILSKDEESLLFQLIADVRLLQHCQGDGR